MAIVQSIANWPETPMYNPNNVQRYIHRYFDAALMNQRFKYFYLLLYFTYYPFIYDILIVLLIYWHSSLFLNASILHTRKRQSYIFSMSSHAVIVKQIWIYLSILIGFMDYEQSCCYYHANWIPCVRNYVQLMFDGSDVE